MTDQRARASVDVLHTMDAQVWAHEFMRLFQDRKEDIDHGLMLAWFANAIMEGFDEANRRNATTEIFDAAMADARRLALEEGMMDCIWTQDGVGEQAWDTTCGRRFLVNEGTPKDNRMAFCCYCGRALKEQPDVEEASHD